jgi:heme-degrading monooxygenase HmoA
VIVRIWTATLAAGGSDVYERFAATQSLAMFRSQPGNLGVLFSRSGSTCTVISLWDSIASVEALAESPSYRGTVRRIMDTRCLVGPGTTTVWKGHGGWLSPALLSDVERDQSRWEIQGKGFNEPPITPSV